MSRKQRIRDLRAELGRRAQERDEFEVALRRLRERAEHESLGGVDISDYGDEFCAGFLSGQENALEEALAEVRRVTLADSNRRAEEGE